MTWDVSKPWPNAAAKAIRLAEEQRRLGEEAEKLDGQLHAQYERAGVLSVAAGFSLSGDWGFSLSGDYEHRKPGPYFTVHRCSGAKEAIEDLLSCREHFDRWLQNEEASPLPECPEKDVGP